MSASWHGWTKCPIHGSALNTGGRCAECDSFAVLPRLPAEQAAGGTPKYTDLDFAADLEWAAKEIREGRHLHAASFLSTHARFARERHAALAAPPSGGVTRYACGHEISGGLVQHPATCPLCAAPPSKALAGTQTVAAPNTFAYWPASAPPETDRLSEARQLVDDQAEDEGLWFVAETAAETYLQAALRELHAAVERARPSPGARTGETA